MKTFVVEYTLDKGATILTDTVDAKDSTKAYLDVCYRQPMTCIIIDVKEVEK